MVSPRSKRPCYLFNKAFRISPGDPRQADQNLAVGYTRSLQHLTSPGRQALSSIAGFHLKGFHPSLYRESCSPTRSKSDIHLGHSPVTNRRVYSHTSFRGRRGWWQPIPQLKGLRCFVSSKGPYLGTLSLSLGNGATNASS